MLDSPCAVITFDDIPSSAWNAAEYMATYGMRGTMFTPSEWVGGANSLTLAQLTAMKAMGWLIANHTTDHTVLTTLSLEEMEAKITGCQTWLNNNGFGDGANYFVAPENEVNSTVITAMNNTGIVMRRGDSGAGSTMPVADNLAVPTIEFSQVGLDAAKAYIHSCYDTCTVPVFMFHRLVDELDLATDVLMSDFESFIDYLHSVGVNTYTFKEFHVNSQLLGGT